jgi:hypothetical protein
MDSGISKAKFLIPGTKQNAAMTARNSPQVRLGMAWSSGAESDEPMI